MHESLFCDLERNPLYALTLHNVSWRQKSALKPIRLRSEMPDQLPAPFGSRLSFGSQI